MFKTNYVPSEKWNVINGCKHAKSLWNCGVNHGVDQWNKKKYQKIISDHKNRWEDENFKIDSNGGDKYGGIYERNNWGNDKKG